MADHGMARDDADIDLEAGHPPPAPTVQTAPNKKRRRDRCCRCVCYTFAAVAALTVVLAAVLGALYVALDPKLPTYTVDTLTVTGLRFDPADFTPLAGIEMAVRMANPNKAIGISYEEGSSLTVWYKDHQLSHGALPAFYQGRREDSLVRVEMSDVALSGAAAEEVLQLVIAGSGGGKVGVSDGVELPIVFRAVVPVRVKVGPVTLTKVTPTVRCDMVLSTAGAEPAIGVKSTSCKIGLKL